MALSASLYGLPLPTGKETDLSALVPPRGHLLLFRWKSRQNHGVAKSPAPGNVLTDRQQELLLIQLCQNFPKAFFPLRKGLDSSECRLLVLLPESRSEEELLKSLSSFQRNFIYWTVVASYFIEEMASLKEIFQQANQLLSYSFYYPESSQTFSLDPEVLATVPSMLSLHAYEKTLREAVHAGKLEAAERSLKELYSLLSRKPRRFPTDVRYRISSMTVNILRELDSMIPSREYDDLLNRAYSLFSICDSFPELFQISYELLKSTSVYFVQETGTTDVVEDIIAYIRKHFTEDLTLPQLAENVHFSANYLSAQIKRRPVCPISTTSRFSVWSTRSSFSPARTSRSLEVAANAATMITAISTGFSAGNTGYLSNRERRIKNVPKINRPFYSMRFRAEALHHPDPFCPDPHAADPADPHAFLRKTYRGQRLKQRLLHRQRQQ